jgi:hypothetical protein
LSACRVYEKEDAMRWILFRAPASELFPQRRGRSFPWVFPGAVLGSILALGGFAQMSQPPSRPPKPLIVPEANPTPDANDRMVMRQNKLQDRNFDLANTERLHQMVKASDMLQTIAIALKAEADKPGPLSENEIRKAETIERLAHIVKERMTITIAPN